MRRFGDKAPIVLLTTSSIIIAAYTTWIQLYYHETYNTFAWDLGIFLQSLESFIFHGKLFYNTVELPYNPSGSYFGIHFSPILFLFAIPYAVYPHPLTLFLVKNLLISFAAIILYSIGREYKLSSLNSALIAASYLFFLPIYGPFTYDFHPYSVFPFFMALTHLYVLRKDYHKGLIAATLGLSTNEYAAILYIFYGLCLLKSQREAAKKIIAISGLWFVIAFATLLSLNPSQLYYYIHYQLLHRLLDRVSVGWDLNKLGYMLMIYALTLFLPILSPLEGFLAITPWLGFSLISSHSPYYSPYYQYSAFILVQLFFAVVSALKLFRSKRLRQVLAISLVALNLSLAIVLGPLGLGLLDHSTALARPTQFQTVHRFDLLGVKTPNKEAMDKALEIIPENASLLVQNHIFPHIYRNVGTYVSLIPGMTGWPVIYRHLDLKRVEKLSIFSAIDGGQRFLGESKEVSIFLNNKRIRLKGATVLRLKEATELRELFFECLLKPERSDIPQVILSSDAVELGMGSGGYLVLLLYSEERDFIVKFSDIPLRAGEWHKLILNITQNEAMVKVDEKLVMRLRIKNRVVSWIVDNVDYVILDSTATVWNFRIGSIPVILGSGYKLIAAGDGVMIFSKNDDEGSVRSLVEGRYVMAVYSSDEPIGKPVMIMPLSRLSWKPIRPPLAPQCLIFDLEEELENVTVTGAEDYAFVEPSEKAYSARSVKIRCSAVISGEVEVEEEGSYIIEVKKSIPSVLEIQIDGEEIDWRKPIYLSSGTHSVEIVWKRIRHPLLEIKLRRAKT